MTSDFSSLGLSASLVQVVSDIGYERPTAIQAQGIPLVLQGKDLICQSKTGSGKTAAFALPILQGIDRTKGLQALIVCPTRELTAQVAKDFRTLGRREAGLVVVELVGGQPVRGQVDALARGVHVAVGTPGRLLDHIDRESLDGRSIKTVVLDEADKMLEMGFGADVESILRAVPKKRQTLLFSATFPSAIESLSSRYLSDATRVTASEAAGEETNLQQVFVECEASEKFDGLLWALCKFPHKSAIVFCNFKKSVSYLQGKMRESGLSVGRLDGDLDQFHRDQVLAQFHNGSIRYLVATDVAGRGLDVKGLELVVNFELPPKTDIYVHRIGRTGRAGRAGMAVSLAGSRELSKISAIEEATGSAVEIQTPGAVVDAKRLAQEAEMQTILISCGRKDKVRPGDILGALTGDAGGLSGDEIGTINIQDRLSYVAVSRRVARSATKSINAGRIKKKRYKATLLS